MIYFNESEKGIEKVILDEQAQKIVLDELRQYTLVYAKTYQWERLDDDREGEDTEETVYPLGENDCPINYSVILRDNHFIGIRILYYCDESKLPDFEEKGSYKGRILYKDSNSNKAIIVLDTYDSPNNHDEVFETYTLCKK